MQVLTINYTLTGNALKNGMLHGDRFTGYPFMSSFSRIFGLLHLNREVLHGFVAVAHHADKIGAGGNRRLEPIGDGDFVVMRVIEIFTEFLHQLAVGVV